MVTKQLIWFIDSGFYYQTTSLDKMVRLADIHQKRIKIIIDTSTQLKGRGYWHLLNDEHYLSKELMATIDKKRVQLLNFFAMNAIKMEIKINQSTDYLAALSTEIDQNDSPIVVIEDNTATKRHPIFQQLTNIKAPVLLLRNKAWKNPINILAAIDPLHEHARPGKLDENIVSLTEEWSRTLKAKWKIAHCCYVTSVLSKYKNKVVPMHRDELYSFAKKKRIPTDKCVLLEGIPEDALTSYIVKHHTDILVLGLVARNKLERLWIGSTTTALLSEPPSDLLLIKQ